MLKVKPWIISLFQLLFVAILPLQVNAQDSIDSIFLKNPQIRGFLAEESRGIGFTGSLFAYNIWGGSFSVVYSLPIKDRGFDVGLSVGRFTVDSDPIKSALNATALSPFVVLVLLNQRPTIPFSWAVSVVYEKDFYSYTENFYTYTGDFFSAEVTDFLDTEISAFSWGSLIYKSIPLSPMLKMVTDFCVIYSFRRTDFTNNYLKANDEKIIIKDNMTSFVFGLSLGINTSSGRVFSVRPGFEVNDNNTMTFSISIGYILSNSSDN